MQRRPKTKRRITLRVLVTEQCNLRCTFCHNEGQSGTKAMLDMEPESLYQFAHLLKKYGLSRIKFSGGEPCLNPRLPRYIKSMQMIRNLDIAVITNAQHIDTLLPVIKESPCRISINLPSLNPIRYQRLTGGRIENVIDSIVELNKRNMHFSLNIYAPLQIKDYEIDELCKFSEENSCTLKFLIPCQIKTVYEQERYIDIMSSRLIKKGYGRRYTGEYFHVFGNNEGLTIRIVKPWCPEVCQKVSERYQTLRLTPRKELKPCFASDDCNLPIPFGNEVEMEKTIKEALSFSSKQCHFESKRVKIIKRL